MEDKSTQNHAASITTSGTNSNTRHPAPLYHRPFTPPLLASSSSGIIDSSGGNGPSSHSGNSNSNGNGGQNYDGQKSGINGGGGHGQKRKAECLCGRKVDDLDRLPPGYRFTPTDVELIVYYLRKKVDRQPLPPNKIHDVNVYVYEPEELLMLYQSPGAGFCYFFTPRDKKYPNGKRPNRAAGNGYWKATGSDKPIDSDGVQVGIKKTLVFYSGKPPRGIKTNWIMQEYRVENPPPITYNAQHSMRLDDWVLCNIYKKKESNTDEDEVDGIMDSEDISGGNSTSTMVSGEPFDHNARGCTSNASANVNVEPLPICDSYGSYLARSNNQPPFYHQHHHQATTNASGFTYHQATANANGFNYPYQHHHQATTHTSVNHPSQFNFITKPLPPTYVPGAVPLQPHHPISSKMSNVLPRCQNSRSSPIYSRPVQPQEDNQYCYRRMASRTALVTPLTSQLWPPLLIESSNPPSIPPLVMSQPPPPLLIESNNPPLMPPPPLIDESNISSLAKNAVNPEMCNNGKAICYSTNQSRGKHERPEEGFNISCGLQDENINLEHLSSADMEKFSGDLDKDFDNFF